MALNAVDLRKVAEILEQLDELDYEFVGTITFDGDDLLIGHCGENHVLEIN
jgi:hypothetical protein